MMNEAELSAQRKQARANLEMAKIRKRSGLATQADIDQAQLIYDKLKNYQIPIQPPPGPAQEAATAELQPILPPMAVSEFTKLLADLSDQYAQARKAQAILSNQLAAIPAEQNAKPLVDKIQEAKSVRMAIGLKIGYLKAHGRLLEDQPDPAADQPPEALKSAFLSNLPADRFELNKLLVNVLQPKLYRRKKALERATKASYRSTYAKEVAQLELQIDLVKRQLSAVS